MAAGAGITLAPVLGRIRKRPDVRFVPLAERPHREVRSLVLGDRPATGVREVLQALAAAGTALDGTPPPVGEPPGGPRRYRPSLRSSRSARWSSAWRADSASP